MVLCTVLNRTQTINGSHGMLQKRPTRYVHRLNFSLEYPAYLFRTQHGWRVTTIKLHKGNTLGGSGLDVTRIGVYTGARHSSDQISGKSDVRYRIGPHPSGPNLAEIPVVGTKHQAHHLGPYSRSLCSWAPHVCAEVALFLNPLSLTLYKYLPDTSSLRPSDW